MRQQESSSDEGSSPTSVPSVPATVGPRSQRKSKTAALSKLTAARTFRIDEDGEDEDSEVTSDDNSEASDEFTE